MPLHACLLLPELLGRIFIGLHPIFPKDARLITQIMSVCHLWHDTALNTPDLWTAVDLYDFDEWHYDALDRWLVLSKSAHLHIRSFTIPSIALVDLFVAHMHHTRRFSMSLRNIEGLSLHKLLLALSRSPVRDLTLQGFHGDDSIWAEEVFTLQQVRLLILTDAWLQWPISLSCPNLESLETSVEIADREFYNLIKSTKALKRLRIWTDWFPLSTVDVPSEDELTPLHLPHLQELSIGWWERRLRELVIGSPALTKLTVRTITPSLGPLRLCPGAHVTELTIFSHETYNFENGVLFFNSDIIMWLDELSHLLLLKIGRENYYGTFTNATAILNGLLKRIDNPLPWRCRSLKKLILSRCVFDPEVLKTLKEQRCDAIGVNKDEELHSCAYLSVQCN